MARTPLFNALRRALAAAELEANPAPMGPADVMLAQPTRRALLQGGAALGALGWAGCAGGADKTPVDPTNGEQDSGVPDDTGPAGLQRVAIIGGGMAGLHCAYRLQQAGADVRVYEANDRLGGRMFSDRGRFGDGQLCELGGELIDTNHATLWALAEELGIQMDDRSAFLTEGAEAEQWWVGGRAVSTETITAQFVELAPTILAQVARGEEDDGYFAEIDETSLADWLDAHVPVERWPELHAVLTVAYRGEFGLETADQSAWNLLYLIGADDPRPFRIFGESDERYHAHTGSDAFPLGLAALLEDGVVQVNRALIQASETATGVALRFVDPDGVETTAEAEHLVFALPFSVLRRVDLGGLSLTAQKRAIIDTLGYGTNAKVMIGFSSRAWATEHGATGSLTTDLPSQQLWETSLGQDGESGILTDFLGGDQGERCGEGTAEAWAADVVLPDLEQVWPGISAAATGTAVRMHWPSAPWSRGSYTCFRPGQWAFWGAEGLREGKAHFCGEHTSLDYQGWMEGAAETGALVAAEIITGLGRPLSAEHLRCLATKLDRPQAGFRAGSLLPLGWRDRQRALARHRRRAPRPSSR